MLFEQILQLTLGCGTILYLVLASRLMGLVRIDNHEKWMALGQPNLVWNNSIRNALRVAGFIWSVKGAEVSRRVFAYVIVLRVLGMCVVTLGVFMVANVWQRWV